MLDLGMSARRINGTFFPSREPSVGRQMPNAAADDVWGDWELTRIFPVTRAEIVRMGKDPSTVAKLEDDIWGLGDDAYATSLDVFHQLHCLNSLAPIAYGSFYNETGVDANARTLRELHVNHCVDIVMQALQCSGNVNLITMHWVETQEYPFPDMCVSLYLPSPGPSLGRVSGIL